MGGGGQSAGWKSPFRYLSCLLRGFRCKIRSPGVGFSGQGMKQTRGDGVGWGVGGKGGSRVREHTAAIETSVSAPDSSGQGSDFLLANPVSKYPGVRNHNLIRIGPRGPTRAVGNEVGAPGFSSCGRLSPAPRGGAGN